MQTSSLPPLKAVVFVGPIDDDEDGDHYVIGETTQKEIDAVKDAAAHLRSHGVTVSEFYPPNANWSQIKVAAQGAHFLIYRGHGVYWSAMPTPNVGGFALNDTFVSNDKLRSELKLAPNAIVMLDGCFTAGSAGNDETSISLDEAKRRVAMYSDPFFDTGAAAYFADWFDASFSTYIDALFAGQTLGQAYKSFHDYNADKMWYGAHPDHPTQEMWLGWDPWYDPKPQYNNAFVGLPQKKLSDLFSPPDMALTPTSVKYLAQIDFAARSYSVAVSSTTSDSFTWTATVDSAPAWLSLTKASGSAGENLTFTLDPTQSAATAVAAIHVTTSAPGIIHPSQDVTVTLLIVDQVSSVYLPTVRR